MRTGDDYRQSLRDGRNVWVLGEGRVDDLNTHPATRGMVDEYALWYDRQLDPAWSDLLISPPGATDAGTPLVYIIPMNVEDLVRMGKAYAKLAFITAGNVTHDPAYGNIILLGILDATQRMNVSPEQTRNAAAMRDEIARTGRFVTFSQGGAPIGFRMRPDPAERTPLRIVKETDADLVLTGRIGMHTSPCFADDVYVGGSNVDYEGKRATFLVPVNAPGVTVVCRKPSVRHSNRFIAPLSSRFDELDGQMWLDDVFVAWERIFFTEWAPSQGETPRDGGRRGIASWLYWHQIYYWLAKAEFTLGIALAGADAMGLKEHPKTLEYIVDLITEVETVKTCMTACELDPETSVAGYAMPNNRHIASGAIAMLRSRQRITETVRSLPGSSLVVAPADTDFADPAMAEGLEESFGGGGYTGLQRSALLNLAWDHTSSALDARESAFELHASGGMVAWRDQVRSRFTRYNELANGVLELLSVDMPELDVSSIGQVARQARREVTPPP